MCRSDGCENEKIKAKGLCANHYSTYLRYGRINSVKTKNGDPQKFFDAALDAETDDCIIWPYSHNGHYPKIGKEYAHRKMCEIVFGVQPNGYECAHACGNSLCINPRHLRWDTHQNNCFDRIDHGTEPRGEKQGKSKLTKSQIDQIVFRRNEIGEKLVSIANDFDVSFQHISAISKGKFWNWHTEIDKKEQKR